MKDIVVNLISHYQEKYLKKEKVHKKLHFGRTLKCGRFDVHLNQFSMISVKKIGLIISLTTGYFLLYSN